MKKTVIMMYPLFSMQEISCLTEILSWNQKEIITAAKDLNPVYTEDGFRVLPDVTYDQIDIDEVDCLILPGISRFFDVLKDNKQISFLRKFLHHPDILIASISSSPALLAEAGLLHDIKYCGGLYQEVIKDLPCFQPENFEPVSVLQDRNVITAFGRAYRQFAFAVSKQLGLIYHEDDFGAVSDTYSKAYLTFTMDEKEAEAWDEAKKSLIDKES